MLDGCEGEHPAGVVGEHAQSQAHVRPLTHSRLYMISIGVYHGVYYKMCIPCMTEGISWAPGRSRS